MTQITQSIQQVDKPMFSRSGTGMEYWWNFCHVKKEPTYRTCRKPHHMMHISQSRLV